MQRYASDPDKSKGRLFEQAKCPYRTNFQRDRERIIHSRAFRRLKHKTQVFISTEGDHYRTRLTHTIEVAQIARALARALNLNEDLAEAVALAHDLGHTPFGHVGEDALNSVMKDYGGFNHNIQAFRIVTEIEDRYLSFKGLNLCWETLEGLVKHNGPLQGEYCKKHYSLKQILDFNKFFDLELDKFSSLEAQCAAIADDIAYNAHDIDDGLRAGILSIKQLYDVPLARQIIDSIKRDYPDVDDVHCGYELARRQISVMVNDVLSAASQRLSVMNPRSLEDIYNAKEMIITFSSEMAKQERDLKAFLYKNFYFHEKLLKIRDEATNIVTQLFTIYMDTPKVLPEEWKGRIVNYTTQDYAKLICDFISGMTDNYAINEYKRLIKE